MAQQLLLDILPASQPTFDNLIVGENAAAINATMSLRVGQALYLWGSDGSGRSHILQAIASHHQGIYLADDEHQAKQLVELANSAHPLPACVAVDDVQRMNDSGLAGLFTLYNRWREMASSEQAFRLVCAGDKAPLQMQLREDVRTRLGWGAVFRLMPLTDSDKLKALMSYAQTRSMPLSDEVLRWLLTHGSRDIRSLFGVVDALDRYALANHRPMTLPLLKSMLAEKSNLLT